MTKCQKDPTCGIFLKRGLFKDIKIIFPCVKRTNTKNTHTKYTNTQIQHMTKCQKDPTCDIFLKGGLFQDIKNYIVKHTNTKIQIHKYTNAQIQHMTKYPKDQCVKRANTTFHLHILVQLNSSVTCF